MATSLLLSEPPLQVLPSLAVAIGLNEAIALQQLFYLQSNPENGKVLKDGERYIFNTYAQWQKYFPFWSEPTIKRVFAELEERHLIATQQPEGMDRRKFYRVPESVQVNLTHERLAAQRTKSSDEQINMISSSDQVDPMIGSNPSHVLVPSKTSSETTSKTMEIPPIPLLLNTPAFAEAWSDWLVYRKERKMKVTATTAKVQFQKLEAWGVEKAVQAIRDSISNNWQGFFEPRAATNGAPAPKMGTGYGRLGLAPSR